MRLNFVGGMKIHFEDDLVETSVFRHVNGGKGRVPSLQIARFHRERERIYSILDPDEREAGFARLHLQWFREWALEALLIGPLKEFPEIARFLSVLAFRKSRTKRDSGAELYVNASGDRSGVIALSPERLDHANALTAFLNHELMHLRDMVDPSFGYRPRLECSGMTQGQRDVARERYRLLWDISIDGRLVRGGRAAPSTRDERWAEMDGAFHFWPEQRRREVFEALWSNAAPTHSELEDLVRDPRQVQPDATSRPGDPCPLCGFPTFAWADPVAVTETVAASIQAEFPSWEVHHPICARCAAVYRVKASLCV